MGKNNAVEKRSEAREQIIGDVLWAYDSNGDNRFKEGAILDISSSGVSICTNAPLGAGTKIRLYSERIWQEQKLCTVRWTQEIAPSVYRSGLLRE